MKKQNYDFMFKKNEELEIIEIYDNTFDKKEWEELKDSVKTLYIESKGMERVLLGDLEKERIELVLLGNGDLLACYADLINEKGWKCNINVDKIKVGEINVLILSIKAGVNKSTRKWIIYYTYFLLDDNNVVIMPHMLESLENKIEKSFGKGE